MSQHSPNEGPSLLQNIIFCVSGVVCGIFTCFFIKCYECPRSGVVNASPGSSMLQSSMPANAMPANAIPADAGYLGATHQRPIQFRFL